MAEQDWIEIRGLQVKAHIGVPEAERAEAQDLLVDLRLQPLRSFSSMPDSLAATVDYFAVSQRVVSLAAERPRQLIETLADEIAGTLIREFALARVDASIRKFILPNTEFVAVHCSRTRAS
jgi:dihydroneopterin aldolase